CKIPHVNQGLLKENAESPSFGDFAPDAPKPVWLSTVSAGKASFSRAARSLLSVTEKNQIAAKANGIDRMPGLGKGVIGAALPNTSTHTVELNTTHTVADTKPRKPPMVAPRVVQPRQEIDNTNTGKLELAAIAKASPTIKATFWFSNTMPKMMDNTPNITVDKREIRI